MPPVFRYDMLDSIKKPLPDMAPVEEKSVFTETGCFDENWLSLRFGKILFLEITSPLCCCGTNVLNFTTVCLVWQSKFLPFL